MNKYKWLTVDIHNWIAEFPLKPCPWCKKTPDLWMPLDQAREIEDKTWIWEIRCRCEVSCKKKTSIRNTTKTNLNRFLDKVDEWVGKWNENNPCIAYEKKRINLKEVPNLWNG